jgi:hypothetical protein
MTQSSMTFILGIVAFAAFGCGTTQNPEEPMAQTRVVFRQYYRGGHMLMMENLAGRDLVKLRSSPVKKGEVPIAWVGDEVMRDLLKSLKRRDFAEYARARPADPRGMGAKGELSIFDSRGRARALLRRNGQPRKEAEAYQECVAAFQKVWTANRPAFQAVTGDGEFGVNRSGAKNGR